MLFRSATLDDFEFSSESNVAVWRGHVRAKDPTMNLTSELLTAKLAGTNTTAASNSRNVESIVAETNVVIEITETNGVTTAKVDKAVYSAADETLVLTGAKPMVDLGTRQIQLLSPHITLDSRNNTATATKPVLTRLPPGALKRIGGGSSAVSGVPAQAAPDERAEVTSDDFVYSSESNTAIWQRNVRVKDPKLNLTSWLLTAKLGSEGGALERIEAETNVVMMITETNGVTIARGDRAIYLAGSELLVLTGKDSMIESGESKFALWSSFITYELISRILNAKPPYRGSVRPAAFSKPGNGDTNLPPRGRQSGEQGK